MAVKPRITEFKSSVMQRRMRMVDAYFENGFNKTAAAIEAGYKPAFAKQMAYSLFKTQMVLDEVARRNRKLARQHNVDVNWVIVRLKQIANFNIMNVMTVQDDGTADFDLTLLTPEMGAAISELTTEEHIQGIGANATIVKKVKLKAKDALRALDMIGKHLGMFTDKIEITEGAELVRRLQRGRDQARMGPEEKE